MITLCEILIDVVVIFENKSDAKYYRKTQVDISSNRSAVLHVVAY